MRVLLKGDEVEEVAEDKRMSETMEDVFFVSEGATEMRKSKRRAADVSSVSIKNVDPKLVLPML